MFDDLCVLVHQDGYITTVTSERTEVVDTARTRRAEDLRIKIVEAVVAVDAVGGVRDLCVREISWGGDGGGASRRDF